MQLNMQCQLNNLNFKQKKKTNLIDKKNDSVFITY